MFAYKLCFCPPLFKSSRLPGRVKNIFDFEKERAVMKPILF